MLKQYIAPQVEDIQLDPLMDGITIANTSKVDVQTADAPGRGNTLKYL